MLLGVQTFHVFNCAKMQKIPKNSIILKNDGHFLIHHPQIKFKTAFKHLRKCSLFFYVGGFDD